MLSTSIISFIESYGYLATFVGAIFEGESVVLLAGLSSHEDYLSFPIVVLFTTAGALVGDWAFFFLGRYKKEKLLTYFPRLKRLMEIPNTYIEKNPKLISFGMRFMYGFRHVVPFSIGASHIPARQFLFWNGAGAVVWAVVFTSAGYFIGDFLQTILGDIRKYEFRIIVFAILAIAAFNFAARNIRDLLRKSAK